MNGMDAVIQIRNRAVKGFSIYADKSWGCAARSPLRASADALHSTSKIPKREVVPVNQGFLCRANLFGAARRRPNCTARRMVERSDTHHRAAALNDGFRKGSTHPTCFFDGFNKKQIFVAMIVRCFPSYLTNLCSI
jgi:hypothetical protein